MAFTAITAGQISVGEPTAKELFQKTKDNFDDHESRIAVLEVSLSSLLPWEWDVRGQASVLDGLDFFRANIALQVLSARIWLIDSGTSGTLTVDVEKSTDGGSVWNTIFSTKPSAAQTDGDFFVSTNQVFASNPTTLAVGDFLRLNTDSVITGSLHFKVLLEFERV